MKMADLCCLLILDIAYLGYTGVDGDDGHSSRIFTT